MANADPILKHNIKYWWLFLSTGALLFIGGFAALCYPITRGLAVVLVLGFVVVLLGIGHILFAAANGTALPHWKGHLVTGIIDVLLGILLVVYPDITVVVMPFLAGFWFLVRGTSMVLYAFTLRRFAAASWGWFFAGGIFIAIFALFVAYFPFLGFFTIAVWTAIALMTMGISNILLAFRLKQGKDETPSVVV